MRQEVYGLALLMIFSQVLSAQERWVYRYDGPGSGNDEASSIVAGDESALYVAGQSMRPVGDYDLIVVSLTCQGARRWVYRYNGPGNGSDLASSMAVDTDGNLYAAGASVGDGTSYDFLVVSLDTSGTERWTYRYNGPGDGYDDASSIAVGEDKSLYITGKSMGGGTDYDIAVVSLTPQGEERWVYRYNSPDSLSDVPHSIFAAPDSNLYVSGYSAKYWAGGPNEDFIVLSLTPEGEERWMYRYNGPGDGDDWANAAVMGSDGNLYVAGRTYGGVSTGHDFTAIGLTPSGDSLWVRRYNGPGNGYDEAVAITLGVEDNLYLAGVSVGAGSAEDFTVMGLTPQGEERWIYRYDGQASELDWARSIVMGRSGSMYVAGLSTESDTSYDFLVVSLDVLGRERWAYRYSGPGSQDDGASCITTGDDGNLYVAGYSVGDGTSRDLTVVSLVGDTCFVDTTQIVLSRELDLWVYAVPATGRVKLSYCLPEANYVKLSLYDTSGRLIRILLDGWEEAGQRTLTWNCKDAKGTKIGTGTYFARIETPDGSLSRRLTVLRYSPFQ